MGSDSKGWTSTTVALKAVCQLKFYYVYHISAKQNIIRGASSAFVLGYKSCKESLAAPAQNVVALANSRGLSCLPQD